MQFEESTHADSDVSNQVVISKRQARGEVGPGTTEQAVEPAIPSIAWAEINLNACFYANFALT